MKNLFRPKKENKTIKGRITRDITNLLELEDEEEDYCKPVKVDNFCSNNYIEYEGNVDRNKI